MRVVVAIVCVIGCGRAATGERASTGSSTPRDARSIDGAYDAHASAACPSPPVEIGPGIVAERRAITAKPAAGEACMDVVRVDLARYRARVLAASRDGGVRTATEWRDAFQLAAVVNAGMFHDDGSPVGMIIRDGVALGADNAKMGGYLALDPRDPGDAPAIVAGRGCAGFDLAALRARYRTIVQSYRLLDCDGGALRWADPKQYSAVAIGVARDGALVLVHARGAVTMAELSRAIAGIDLAGALFLEGGPEATLVAGSLVRIGSYETGFNENDANVAEWKLPLVIGIAPR
jgi:hypothetical protein